MKDVGSPSDWFRSKWWFLSPYWFHWWRSMLSMTSNCFVFRCVSVSSQIHQQYDWSPWWLGPHLLWPEYDRYKFQMNLLTQQILLNTVVWHWKKIELYRRLHSNKGWLPSFHEPSHTFLDTLLIPRATLPRYSDMYRAPLRCDKIGIYEAVFYIKWLIWIQKLLSI